MHGQQNIKIGLHVSTSYGSSSGPHSNIDPDIQMFNALWDPQHSQLKCVHYKNIQLIIYFYNVYTLSVNVGDPTSCLTFVCLDLYYYEGLKMTHQRSKHVALI